MAKLHSSPGSRLCLPVQERAPRPEGLLACANSKQERIRHATLTASKLPPAFSSHTAREKELLAAAAAFRERWVASAAAAAAAGMRTRRLLPAVTMLNECGAEKVVCTTLRPASLPHVELYDLEGIAQVRGSNVWGSARRRAPARQVVEQEAAVTGNSVHCQPVGMAGNPAQPAPTPVRCTTCPAVCV